MKTQTTTEGDTPATTTDEPRNVAVRVLENRTKIGGAICAIGPCDFPLTHTEAEQLKTLGKVEIIGLF